MGIAVLTIFIHIVLQPTERNSGFSIPKDNFFQISFPSLGGDNLKQFDAKPIHRDEMKMLIDSV